MSSAMTVPSCPLSPGEPAPDFAVPAVNREGRISLSDFRGRHAVLLGLFRGLHCPFCRRQLSRLALLHERLTPLGVETVGIVNTPLERARLYFRYRPTRAALGADPDVATHRAFGVPKIELVPAEAAGTVGWPYGVTLDQLAGALINPTGELPAPVSVLEANEMLNRQDGFELTPVDQQIDATHGTQLAAYFLLDRSGVIRWSPVEGLRQPNELGLFPGDDEIVGAARTL